LYFPENHRQWETCAQSIEHRIANKPGIHRVQIIPQTQPDPTNNQAAIELDYDPDLLSLAEISRYVQQAGATFNESIACLILPIEGLVSSRLEHPIQAALNKLPGVTATISFASQTLRVEFDRRQCALPEIVRQLDRFGVHIKPGPAKTTRTPPHRDWITNARQWMVLARKQPDLVTAVLGGLCLIAAWLMHVTTGPDWLRFELLILSYILCGWRTTWIMLKSLRHLQFDIDLLMFAAAFGAASLGHYEEGALLLLLFALGGAGENLAMNKARSAITALAAIVPQTAIVLDPQRGQREVPVEELRVLDRVLIRPSQRVPADGHVVGGASAIDQSPITGESIPIEKTVGDTVFAGSINGDGLLTIEVSKPSNDNTIAKIIRLVEEAQSTKSQTQIFTDRVEHWYVPIVLIVTTVLITIPPLLNIPSPRNTSIWAGWFYQAMAFLTAASPCALAIGTPAAVLSGIGRAARGGVLIKGGSHLENLSRVQAIAFDKTGTLTRGRPEVTDIFCFDPHWNETSLLSIATSIERGSEHPLAQAIVAEAEARELHAPPADDVEQVPGLGIVGHVDSRRVAIGRLAIMNTIHAPGSSPDQIDNARNHVEKLESQGKTTMLVAIDAKIVGAIGLADQPRPGAQSMIDQLKHLGIRRTIMLTGDNSRTAAAVARSVGIDQYYAELLPADKLEKVKQLDREYGQVAMVGDGVNDAPAMANATVGIAVGGALGSTSDVALETADVALLSDDLHKLPEAIGISRFARRIIVQNLIIALGVIFILAPLAALGYSTIYTAVIFHEGSTVIVVINALRILAYHPPPSPQPDPSS
jgi:Cd2+/Zn2+-exporting ATPase